MGTRPQQRTLSATIPAPVGGLNGRDPLDLMSDTDARTMVNWWPATNRIELRRGHVQHATGMGSGAVQTVAELVTATGTRKLLAAANGNLYDATPTGAASSLASGLSNNKWQCHQFRGKLFCVNGADAPRDWDGTTLASTSWTGLTIADLIHVTDFKSRLYFVEKDSGSVWYGAVNGITGGLTEFDVLSLLNNGGSLLFCTQWSRQTGDGNENQFVMVGSEGDVLIYGGDYPGGTWSLSRRLVIPRPLSNRAYMRLGADIVIATEGGMISLSDWMLGRPPGTETLISDKVNTQLIKQAENYSTNFGWQILNYPRRRMLLLNVPTTEDRTSSQRAWNTQTGAPTTFLGLNASSWALFNNVPYFGGMDGKIYKADSGLDDAGSAIAHEVAFAFNYFGDRTSTKRILNTRPIFDANNSVTLEYGFSTDLVDSDVEEEIEISVTAPVWGVAVWGTSTWGSSKVANQWATVHGTGRSASLKIKGSAQSVELSLSSVQVVYDMGGAI